MKLGQLLRESKGVEWLKPRYLRYIQNPDLAAEGPLAAEILTRPERDRSKGWSASSSGRCLREQMYKARKAEAEPYSERARTAFQNGHYVHLRHQTAGLVAGYITQVEIPVGIEELNVRGTMDGITSEDEIAEWKSINPRGYATVNQFGPDYKHVRQVNAYMWAAGLSRARILYENKANNELKEFLVEMTEEHDSANKRDWIELNERYEDGTLPPMLEQCKMGKGEIKTCPYAQVCLKDEAERPRLRIRRTSSSGGD